MESNQRAKLLTLWKKLNNVFDLLKSEILAFYSIIIKPLKNEFKEEKELEEFTKLEDRGI